MRVCWEPINFRLYTVMLGTEHTKNIVFGTTDRNARLSRIPVQVPPTPLSAWSMNVQM